MNKYCRRSSKLLLLYTLQIFNDFVICHTIYNAFSGNYTPLSLLFRRTSIMTCPVCILVRQYLLNSLIYARPLPICHCGTCIHACRLYINIPPGLHEHTKHNLHSGLCQHGIEEVKYKYIHYELYNSGLSACLLCTCLIAYMSVSCARVLISCLSLWHVF